MVSIENREGKCSRTTGSVVPVNAPAARSTMDDDSRTGCQPVQDNARAARCTGKSRTRSLRVQDVAPDSNAPAARSTNAARCTVDSRTCSLRVQNELNERTSRAFYQEFPDAIASASYHFYSRFASTDVHTRNLPHWAANNVLVFVTYRLADSIPADKRCAWQEERDAWMRIHPEPWDEETMREYYEQFPAKLDAMLDAGYGSCVLSREDCRMIVVDNLLYFNEDRYRLHAFVVMSNHVHVLMELKDKTELSKVLHSWKSYTAKQINAVVGGKGRVWQKEYFDRLIRDSVHYERTLKYIRKNAEVAAAINARADSSRTGCQPVQDNVRAARCTENSRTRSLRVQEVDPDSNAPAARSTNAARCTEAEAARCTTIVECAACAFKMQK